MKNQKIIPNLWFEDQTQEAVEFYTSLFEDWGIGKTSRYTEVGQEFHQRPPGSVMTVEFQLGGYQMLALNGGPHFKFNPSISFFVFCRNEEEVNRIWKGLSEAGEVLMPLESYEWSPRYGWVQDRYGLNWQLALETDEAARQKLVPLLFFTGGQQGKAEEAIKFYTSVFASSNIEGILKYSPEDRNEYAEGHVKHAQFQLEGETFMAMDSGMENDFPFNEAISFIVNCEDQEEIDRYWNELTAGGDPKAQQCGWLKDKFGVSWQIVPAELEKLMNQPDEEKAKRVMEALLKMKKIELGELEKVRK